MSIYFTNPTSKCDRTFYLYSDSGLTTTASTAVFNIDSATGIVTISTSSAIYSGITYTLYVTSVLTANDPDSKASSILRVYIKPCKITGVSLEFKAFTVNANPIAT